MTKGLEGFTRLTDAAKKAGASTTELKASFDRLIPAFEDWQKELADKHDRNFSQYQQEFPKYGFTEVENFVIVAMNREQADPYAKIFRQGYQAATLDMKQPRVRIFTVNDDAIEVQKMLGGTDPHRARIMYLDMPPVFDVQAHNLTRITGALMEYGRPLHIPNMKLEIPTNGPSLRIETSHFIDFQTTAMIRFTNEHGFKVEDDLRFRTRTVKGAYDQIDVTITHRVSNLNFIAQIERRESIPPETMDTDDLDLDKDLGQ